MRNFIDIINEAQVYPEHVSNAELTAMSREGDDPEYHANDDHVYFDGRGATLRQLRVADLTFGNGVDQDIVDIYTGMHTAAPPIIVDGNQVENGNHRLAAARARGEDTISAYVLD